MEGNFNILSNNEWAVMEQLWGESPQTLMELVKGLEKKLGWAPSTTKTMISRMEKKGYLRFEQGLKARLYYPIITRESAEIRETEELLEKVFQGSVGMLLNSFVGSRKLTQNEIAQLQEIIDKAKEEQS